MDYILPVNKRKFHTFISHAHTDKELVDKLVYRLTELADIPVWYDGNNLQPSGKVASYLPNAVNNSRSMIIIISSSSIKSGWVEEEYNLAVNQRTQFGDFRIIPIRIEKSCAIPGFLNATKWIDITDGIIDTTTVNEILKGMYYCDHNTVLKNTRDIYVSRSWRKEESLLADFVCNILDSEGFRLIGDSANQSTFDIDRVKSIIANCGSFVAILPCRDIGTTSIYILDEIKIARSLNLPILLIADSKVILPEDLQTITISVNSDEFENNFDKLQFAIAVFAEKWNYPASPHYIFFSTSFNPSNTRIKRIIAEMIELITAMPCIIGDDIREGNIQETIQKKISAAYLMITDISEGNINTCIEGGIGLGAKIPLYFISHVPRKSPPFMFRGHQIWYYENDLELMGVIHKILYPHRKRILNYELKKRSWS